MQIFPRVAIALTISFGFIMVPGIVQAEDCALAPGPSVVFGSDTCQVDPSEFAVEPQQAQPAVNSMDDALNAPDNAVDEPVVVDGQWDWPAPTGDDADPN